MTSSRRLHNGVPGLETLGLLNQRRFRCYAEIEITRREPLPDFLFEPGWGTKGRGRGRGLSFCFYMRAPCRMSACVCGVRCRCLRRRGYYGRAAFTYVWCTALCDDQNKQNGEWVSE